MNANNTDVIIPVGVSLTDDAPNKTEANLVLVINHRVLSLLKRYDLDINQAFILLALYDEAIGLLDVFDEDLGNQKVLISDYQHLHIHGFITIPAEGAGPLYQLDEKGKVFVEQVRVLFDVPDEEKQTDAEIKKLAGDYLELWPKMKLPSGVYARVSIVEIEKKMKAFFRVYKGPLKKEYDIKLTTEDVLAATKGYIARYAKANYNYMINSSYFIQKKEKSSLADEIIAAKQGTIKQGDKWTKQV